MVKKQAINEFENMLNQAKVNAYSKQSLKQPLNSGLNNFKEAVCNQYGFSKEELNKVMGEK